MKKGESVFISAVRTSVSVALLSGIGFVASAEEKRQTVLEEVVVTAQKRVENLQDVPIAITAVSSEELEAKGIQNLRGVLESTPTIATQPYINTTSGSINVAMRGVGQDGPDSIRSESAVGIYRDGFYMARGQAMSFDLADIERVEVLRGPQGTLYGRNTDGGAINVISKKPTGEFGFKQNLSYGRWNDFRSLTTVNLPAWNDVATKFAFLRSGKDGYVANPSSSGHDFGYENRVAGRFDLSWKPVQSFLLDYFIETGNTRSTSLFFQNWVGLPGTTVFYNAGSASYVYPSSHAPLRTAPRPYDLPTARNRSTSMGLTLSWNIGESLAVKSLTGYSKLKGEAIGEISDIAGFPLRDDPDIDNHGFSQEFQFIGDFLEKRFSYVAGLYYFSERSVQADAITGDFGTGDLLLSASRNRASNKSRAAYGQVTWKPPVLDDKLDLTLGGRYTKDTRNGQDTQLPSAFAPDAIINPPFSLDSDKFTPTFMANYHWTDDLSTYAKYSTGFLAATGGFNRAIGQFKQKPETLISYELGLKSFWLDRRLRLNLAAFLSKYKDRQIAVGGPDPATPGVYLYIPTNAGRSTIKGVEVELEAKPIEDVTLSFNYAYLHNAIDYIGALAGGPYDQTVNPLSPYRAGDNIAGAFAAAISPANSLSVSGDYTFWHFSQSALTAHLDYRYQSSVDAFGSSIPNYKYGRQPSHYTLDGRLTWSADLGQGEAHHMNVSLWGRNLTNRDYVLLAVAGGGNGLIVPTFPGDSTALNTGSRIWAPPRSYGVDLSYQF